MQNIYDEFLKLKRLIPSQVVQTKWEEDQKKVTIDKEVMDFLNDAHPVASAILIYMAVKVETNHVVEFTMQELMNATGLNRTTVRRALGFLTDYDYVIPLRKNPASLMMI